MCGNYSREETIWGNTVYIFFNTSIGKIFFAQNFKFRKCNQLIPSWRDFKKNQDHFLLRNLKTQKGPKYPNYSLKMLLNLRLKHVSFQGKTSHKFMDETSNPFIRIYYTSRPVLFGMCAGNEIFYASLYLLHFTNGPFYIFNITAVLCFPVAIAKLAIALFQVCND